MPNKNQNLWISIIIILITIISIFHFRTPTMKWQYHLLYMQAYFIPIILSAFLFGIRGGLGSALIVSVVYFPHIILQHGGLIEGNLMRFLQIALFNILGFLIGLKAQGEKKEKEKYQSAAIELEKAYNTQKRQLEMISDMERQLRASDRLATIGELTASLAHEVRNPLGSIRGAVDIIRDAVPDDIKKLEFFDILIQDTERLNAVVENYLSFAKKQASTIITYELQQTMNNIILMIGAHIRKSQIRLNTNFESETLLTKSDPTHLWQVMMNILLNAIQATPDGGSINLSLKEIKPIDNKSADKIHQSVGIQRMARIAVKDQGPGINPEKLEEIYKPFYTTRPQGTGLGLAIVKRLADDNGWHISVQSKPGVGTEFAILIPILKNLNK